MSTDLQTDPYDARPQHCVFAHHILREEAFLATDTLLTALEKTDQEYIRHQWIKALVRCRMSDIPVDYMWSPIEEIRVSTFRRTDVTCYVISMPEAKYTTEAFFVALVKAPQEIIRYYTLEYGFQFDGTVRTVFCEWTADGKHVNFGDGPPATVEAFADRIFQQVEEERNL